MPYLNVDTDLRLYYEEYLPDKTSAGSDGTGPPPIVFLHGFTLDLRMWERQVAYFRRTHRVLAVDARGHGRSDAPPTGYSRADRVADFAHFVDRLNLPSFHLVGLSMGGSTSIAYALEHQQRLASLTLVSTGAAGWDIGKRISRIDRLAREKGLEAARAQWMKTVLAYFTGNREALGVAMEAMITDHSGAPWMDPRRGQYPSPGNDLERVHRISVPTCIFVGSLDRMFAPLGHTLADKMPRARVMEYNGVGHMLNMEAADRFNRDLETFLRDAEDSG